MRSDTSGSRQACAGGARAKQAHSLRAPTRAVVGGAGCVFGGAWTSGAACGVASKTPPSSCWSSSWQSVPAWLANSPWGISTAGPVPCTSTDAAWACRAAVAWGACTTWCMRPSAGASTNASASHQKAKRCCSREKDMVCVRGAAWATSPAGHPPCGRTARIRHERGSENAPPPPRVRANSARVTSPSLRSCFQARPECRRRR